MTCRLSLCHCCLDDLTLFSAQFDFSGCSSHRDPRTHTTGLTCRGTLIRPYINGKSCPRMCIPPWYVLRSQPRCLPGWTPRVFSNTKLERRQYKL
eukprot:9051494-Pyramimonas_sp.AAC.1